MQGVLAAQYRDDEVAGDVAASVEPEVQLIEQRQGAAVGAQELGGELKQRPLDVLERPGEPPEV